MTTKHGAVHSGIAPLLYTLFRFGLQEYNLSYSARSTPSPNTSARTA